MLHLLPDLIILVVDLSKCKGSATEIAQFQLGDLTFKVHFPHYIYSSALVKVLWDICSTISTPVLTCPKSSSMSQLSSDASNRSILNACRHPDASHPG